MPRCRYRTLSERGGYEICILCNWEDDGQHDPHADEQWGGPNGAYSLSEVRSNFKLHLIMYSPDKATKRLGENVNNQLEHQTKRIIMGIFDSMVGTTDPAILADLWQRIDEHEKILRQQKNH